MSEYHDTTNMVNMFGWLVNQCLRKLPKVRHFGAQPRSTETPDAEI